MGRASLHCVCKAVTEEYNGSFILLWKHGTACSSVNRVRTKYITEQKQNRAEHSHPLVAWFMGLAPEHLCRLGSQPVRGAYTNLIYMCRTSHQLSSLTCPSAPSRSGPLASAGASMCPRTRHMQSIVPCSKGSTTSLGYRKSGSSVAQMSRY